MAADYYNSYSGYTRENYVPFMMYEERPNDKYGVNDLVYYSLDGRIETVYNSVEHTTYYQFLSEDFKEKYSTYTYTDPKTDYKYTEERDTKNKFYSTFN